MYRLRPRIQRRLVRFSPRTVFPMQKGAGESELIVAGDSDNLIEKCVLLHHLQEKRKLFVEKTTHSLPRGNTRAEMHAENCAAATLITLQLR